MFSFRRPVLSKHTKRLGIWSTAAITLGIITAATAIYTLNHLDAQTQTRTASANFQVKLTQDQAMLQALSSRLNDDTNVADDARALSNIAPAAGEPLAGSSAQPAPRIPAYRGPVEE